MRLSGSTVATLAHILFFSIQSVKASFLRDVAGYAQGRPSRNQMAIEDALLSKAISLEEYNQKLQAKGLQVIATDSRRLDEDGADGQDEAANDDYYLDANYMYSFSGYSLKYAKCQPVQRFSEYAIKAGEYTPMVTDDIVILRLCPYRFCTASRTFGCHYNFAEYAQATGWLRWLLRVPKEDSFPERKRGDPNVGRLQGKNIRSFDKQRSLERLWLVLS